MARFDRRRTGGGTCSPSTLCLFLFLALTQREQDESTQTGELQRRSNDVYEDDDDFIGRHMCALGCAELGDNRKG